VSNLPTDSDDVDKAGADRIARLEQRVLRERVARKEAERLLESKSLELFTANLALQELATSLERRVEERTAEVLTMEAQLRHSMKMEAIGLLAGGIAHDFNNLLMVIGTGAELLYDESPEGRSQILDELASAVARGRELTSSLLAFSRKQPVQAEQLDTGSAITTLAHLLRRLLKESAILSLDLTPGLAVRMSRGSLEQILMNLAANARDAMPHGGELHIRTMACPLSAAEAGAKGLHEGMHVLIEVRDTGIGMSADTVQRAFDPFFSTKPVGSGTGLGLATVYSIVRQSGGHISIDSAVGSGSTFRLLLPWDGTAAEAGHASGNRHTSTLQMAGDVLLVDDNDSVRHVTASLLRRHGLSVREASSGEQALAILSDQTIPLAMLITDVRMPGMNGFELVQMACGRRSGMPTLLMSGYVDDRRLQEQIEEAGLVMMEKPVDTDALLQHLHHVLGQRVALTPGVAT
jgi:signal transduction histidine kinase/CheY-like chemotaxis protein